MKIFINKNELLHFFDSPPDDVNHCFYTFENKPKCEKDEKIFFYCEHNLIATALVYDVIRVKNYYAVVWNKKDFNNLVFSSNAMYGSLFHN